MKKILKFSIMLLVALNLIACGKEEEEPVVENVSTEQTAELPKPPVIPPKEIQTYWSETVEDYEVILRDAQQDNLLELLVKKGEQEWSVLTFDITNDYRSPEDISIDTFEDIMGHSGFRVYECYEMGSEVVLCGTDYFAVEEEPIHLALSWCALEDLDAEKTSNVYSVDLDDDGIMELVCNVQWMADGKEDAKVYRWDGEQVYVFHGTDILHAEESNLDIKVLASLGAEYLPEKNVMLISYWDDATQSQIEKEYEINMEKLEMYEFR